MFFLTQYDKTVYEVYNVEGSVDTLIELMQIYREKGAIFNSTCMLLGILGMLDRCRMVSLVLGYHKLSVFSHIVVGITYDTHSGKSK